MPTNTLTRTLLCNLVVAFLFTAFAINNAHADKSHETLTSEKKLFKEQIQKASPIKTQFLPVVQSLNAIGTFYGVAYSRLKPKDYQLLAGVVGGDATGGGVSYRLLDGASYDWTFSTAYIASIAPIAYFSRSSDPEDSTYNTTPFRQQASLVIASVQAKDKSKYWNLDYGLSYVNSIIDHYQTEDRDKIETPEISLTPFTQFIGDLGISNRFTLSAGLETKLSWDINSKSSSSGFASDVSSTLGNKWYFSPVRQVRLVMEYFHSSVLTFEDPGYDREKVAEIFNIQCGQVSDSARQTECLALERALVDYVHTHNTNGTARALGGPTYLKAYTQNRFRGSRTNYLGLDTYYRFSDKLSIPSAYVSLESGAASDDDLDAFHFDRQSVSVGALWSTEDVGVLLLYADGDDGSSVTFTLKSTP